MLAAATIQGFPWLLIPGAAGFLIAFIVQFQLKYHVDREKIVQLDDMAKLYPNGIPPRKILTERGQRLYLWYCAGGVLCAASIILCLTFYSK